MYTYTCAHQTYQVPLDHIIEQFLDVYAYPWQKDKRAAVKKLVDLGHLHQAVRNSNVLVLTHAGWTCAHDLWGDSHQQPPLE